MKCSHYPVHIAFSNVRPDEVEILWCSACGAVKVGKAPWRTPKSWDRLRRARDGERTAKRKLATLQAQIKDGHVWFGGRWRKVEP